MSDPTLCKCMRITGLYLRSVLPGPGTFSQANYVLKYRGQPYFKVVKHKIQDKKIQGTPKGTVA